MKGVSLLRFSRSAAPPLAPEEGATYWSARKRLGLMTSCDEAAFQTWLAVPAHAAALALLEATLEDIGTLAAAPEIRRMREAALAVARARSSKRGWQDFVPVAAVAAAVACVAVILVGVVVQGRSPGVGTREESRANVTGKRYSTARGQILSVTLEDGSVVALDTVTTLEVAFSPARREVRLLQGQASFHVAKNKGRPFVVTAGDRAVTAIGTAFDVRLDDGRVEVVLMEGRIAVDPLKREGLARLVPALSHRELEPGERLTAAAGTAVTVAATDLGRATSWEHGQLIFRDDTVAAAVAEMNRYGATQLVIDDPRVAGLKISGVFGATHQDNFVAALTAAYPITAAQRSPGVTALSWHNGGAEQAPR